MTAIHPELRGPCRGAASTSYPALSVRQPWAWSILWAGKDVENRTWATKYRGCVWLHAARRRPTKADLEAYHQVAKGAGARTPGDVFGLAYGGIIGLVRILDVYEPYLWYGNVISRRSRWGVESQYRWVVQVVGRFRRPVYAPGRLGLFALPEETEAACRRALQESQDMTKSVVKETDRPT